MGTSNKASQVIKLISFLSLVSLISTTAYTKDMTHRLGIGYSNDFAVTPMPSLAMKYYPSTDIAVSLALGIDTNTANSSSGQSNFGIGGKFYKTIFTETVLNFYMGAGVSLLSSGPASGGTGSTSSGFDIDGFGGAEFYLPGLDNLGFNFQFGAGVTSISSGVRFRTIGDTPLNAGIYFYF
jgi:hypothetical protein